MAHKQKCVKGEGGLIFNISVCTYYVNDPIFKYFISYLARMIFIFILMVLSEIRFYGLQTKHTFNRKIREKSFTDISKDLMKNYETSYH